MKKNNVKSAKIVAFEGNPGSNKSIIISNLKNRLIESGHSVLIYDCISHLNDIYALMIKNNCNRNDLYITDLTNLYLLNKNIFSIAQYNYDYILLENYIYNLWCKKDVLDIKCESEDILLHNLPKPNFAFFIFNSINNCLVNLKSKRAIGFWESGLFESAMNDNINSLLSDYYRGDICVNDIEECFTDFQSRLQQQYVKLVHDGYLNQINSCNDKIEEIVNVIAKKII